MTLRKKIVFSLITSFALGLNSPFAPADTVTSQSGIIPARRAVDYEWMSIKTWEKMHAEDMLVAQYDQVDVLLLGDSITAGWDWQLWEKHFIPLKAANFGIGGDNTGNVLWRLQHGAVGNLQPRLIVLLIGVNNLGGLQESPEQAADGVTRVVRQLQLAWPNSKILLNAVFPFDKDASSPNRIKVKQLNKIIARLENNKTVFFKDYGPLLLEEDGSIAPETMKDFLHPTPEGYAVWANAMTPDIQELLKH
jgi:lysophospholipase L1-like esterase